MVGMWASVAGTVLDLWMRKLGRIAHTVAEDKRTEAGRNQLGLEEGMMEVGRMIVEGTAPIVVPVRTAVEDRKAVVLEALERTQVPQLVVHMVESMAVEIRMQAPTEPREIARKH
eukprot:Colp12_sorted_trinity150504_noHs@24959